MPLDFGVLRHFRLEKLDKKIEKFHKDVKFLCITFVPNRPNVTLNIYTLLSKRNQTFWFRDFGNTLILDHIILNIY